MNIPYEPRPAAYWPAQFTELPVFQETGGLYFGNAVFYPDRERIAVFIDGPNLFATVRNLNSTMHQVGITKEKDDEVALDYKRLLALFTRLGIFTHASYYTAQPVDEGYSAVKPLTDWLDYNGFRLVTKPTKSFTDEKGVVKIKGNMDCELIVDVLKSVYEGGVDHVVIFSGDGDFRALIDACQSKRARVTVVSSTLTHPVMIADELRRQASQFIELYSLLPLIRREKTERDDTNSNVPFREPVSKPRVEPVELADEA